MNLRLELGCNTGHLCVHVNEQLCLYCLKTLMSLLLKFKKCKMLHGSNFEVLYMHILLLQRAARRVRPTLSFVEWLERRCGRTRARQHAAID